MRCYRSQLASTAAGLIALLTAAPVAAQELTLAVDVPTELQGATYLANQTVRWSQASYSLRFDGPAEGLGPAANIDALVVVEDGSFLFSADAPITLASTTYEARDVVRYDTGTYSMHVDGGSLGLSASANVDALARDQLGRLVLSVDAPQNLFGLEVMASDLLVLEQGDLSVLVSGASMGLSAESDVVGLERDAGGWYLMVAEPTTAGSVTVLPGQVARWDDAELSLFHADPAFPPGSAGSGLSFPGSPGAVEVLQLDRTGGDVELSWAPSCSSEASDYAVYEGPIGNWAGKVPVVCSTSGSTNATVTPEPGDRFFLVVPKNGRYEGSYGRDSAGNERLQSTGSCLTVQRLGSCS